MADADEDNTARGPQTHDCDLSEETQDFRFLNSIINAPTLAESPSLPKRGDKDFEPNATTSQAATLIASRQAMYTALSFPRLHQAKAHVVAQYCPKQAPYEGPNVRVDNAHGPYFRTMGKSDSRNRIWLLPEEALYLIERGSLDIQWSDWRDMHDQGGGEVDEGGEEDSGEPFGELPMSLQGAYASLIGKSGLTLERYQVFAWLRRLGYTVIRAPTWDDGCTRMKGQATVPAASPPITKAREQEKDSQQGQQQQHQVTRTGIPGLIDRLLSYLFAPRNSTSKACPAFGPLVAPGLYRSYNDIYHALRLIPFDTGRSTFQSSALRAAPVSVPKAPFCISYHVWKPSTTYRKTNPPEPDFRVAVLDARDTSVPTISQIGALLDSIPDEEPPKDKPLEARLKHGRRNVMLAVVDMGVVSFLRFSEAAFGAEKLFESKSKTRQWKKGGHGGRARSGRGRKSNA